MGMYEEEGHVVSAAEVARVLWSMGNGGIVRRDRFVRR